MKIYRTRRHEVALMKDQCRLDVRKYSFPQRTINKWNKLPADCVANSVNMFKNSVNIFKNNFGKYIIRVGHS